MTFFSPSSRYQRKRGRMAAQEDVGLAIRRLHADVRSSMTAFDDGYRAEMERLYQRVTNELFSQRRFSRLADGPARLIEQLIREKPE